MIIIEDPLDARIAQFHLRERQMSTKADRRERVPTGLFVAEGDLVVERALAAGCEPVCAFVDDLQPPTVIAQFGPEVVIYGAREDVRRVGMGLGVPLSITALFRRPQTNDVASVVQRQRVVALECLDNPVNVGAIVRSAVALGWNGLLLDRNSADPLTRRALRVSMGNAFLLPFARTQNLARTVSEAKAAGTLVIALTPTRSVPLESVVPALDQPVMLLIGSERAGLSSALLDAASVCADIPMAEGVDSLNAAAAAAVACYALRPARTR